MSEKFVASVWDWDALRYDYYECDGRRSIGGWDRLSGGLGISGQAAQIPESMKKIGVTLEEILPRLPAGSRLVGSGEQAIGQIMVKEPKASTVKTPLAPLGNPTLPETRVSPSFFPYLFAAAAGGALGITAVKMSSEKNPPAWKWIAVGGVGFLAGGTLAWNTRGYVQSVNNANGAPPSTNPPETP